MEMKHVKRERGKESNSNLVYLLENIIYKIIEIFFLYFLNVLHRDIDVMNLIKINIIKRAMY